MTLYLCDSNVWIALATSGHVHNAVAQGWLNTVEDPASILFCRATQQSFLRLLTNVSVFPRYRSRPLSNEEAWAIYDAIIGDERVVFAAEPEGIEPYWRDFAVRATASPKLWMDAYLAAFARAEGCRLVTIDKAFRQFRGLDLVLLGEGSPA